MERLNYLKENELHDNYENKSEIYRGGKCGKGCQGQDGIPW
jgi:hypothetical protein